MVIAMMANTYTKMKDMKRGLYNYQVLHTYPTYKMNKYFGGMIAVTPPFNILCVMALPLFISWRKDK